MAHVSATLEICDDCVVAIANDDYSGMDDATEGRVRRGIESACTRYGGWLTVGEELGFSYGRCNCCGQLAGNRHEANVLSDAAKPIEPALLLTMGNARYLKNFGMK